MSVVSTVYRTPQASADPTVPADPAASLASSGHEKSGVLAARLSGERPLQKAATATTGDKATCVIYAVAWRWAPDQCDSAVSSMSALDAAGSSDASESI